MAPPYWEHGMSLAAQSDDYTSDIYATPASFATHRRAAQFVNRRHPRDRRRDVDGRVHCKSDDTHEDAALRFSGKSSIPRSQRWYT